MAKIKNIMAYTNPIAIALAIPLFIGGVLGVLGFRIGKDIKTAAKMLRDTVENE